MKPSAFLINTSRGGLIDETALFETLRNRQIAGAGLDVLTKEPPELDNPLFSLSNCVITPHIAWASGAARQKLLNVVVENVRSFLQGSPQNVVC
jgi:glycerate dehydrogenase